MKKNIIKVIIILLCLGFVVWMGTKVGNNATDDPKEGTLEEEENSTGEGTDIEENVNEIGVDESGQTNAGKELQFNPMLRVLITTDDFLYDYHEKVEITSNRDFTIQGEDGTIFAYYNAWEKVDLDAFSLKEGECLIFRGEGKMLVSSINRAQGNPSYYGSLEIYKDENGYCIINEVAMEDYLKNVVPSEMMSNYPQEALKAQAVCARSYAYSHFLSESTLPYGANMNDSTDFQVYNNIQETDSTNSAVAETAGKVLLINGEPKPVYFFSTSCGYTTNESIWKPQYPEPEHAYGSVAVKEEMAREAMSTDRGYVSLYQGKDLAIEQNFESFLLSETNGFLEQEEQWFRWSYEGQIEDGRILARMQERYAVRNDLILTWDKDEETYVSEEIKRIGNITDIEVIKRLEGGIADELLVETTENTYLIVGEYNIRYILSDGVSDIVRNDGSVVTVTNLLPSAYFIIEPVCSDAGVVEKITLTGGGYGHGVGMSQNGAKQAALQGMNYEEILMLFYRDFQLEALE